MSCWCAVVLTLVSLVVQTRFPLDLLMMIHSPSSQTHPRRRACHGATGTICVTPAAAGGDANTSVSLTSCLHRATSPLQRHGNWGADGTKVVVVLYHRRAALVLQEFFKECERQSGASYLDMLALHDTIHVSYW